MHNSNRRAIITGIRILVILVACVLLTDAAYRSLILDDLVIARGERDSQAFIEGHPRITYVPLGDSHTRYAIHPAYLPGTYNFAMGSESYFFSYHLLRDLVERQDVDVETILLQIDTNSFSDAVARDSLLANDVWYWKDRMDFDEMRAITSRSEADLRISAALPLLGRGMDTVRYLVRGERTDMHLGWANYSGIATPESLVNGARVQYERDFASGQCVNGTSVEYFRKTLAYAHEHGIHVILIKYPLAPQYQGLLERGGNLDPYYDTVLDIADEMGPYRLLDYQQAFDKHPEYFNDIDHLNYHGAIAFTRMLAQDLKKMEAAGESVETIRSGPYALDPHMDAKAPC